MKTNLYYKPSSEMVGVMKYLYGKDVSNNIYPAYQVLEKLDGFEYHIDIEGNIWYNNMVVFRPTEERPE